MQVQAVPGASELSPEAGQLVAVLPLFISQDAAATKVSDMFGDAAKSPINVMACEMTSNIGAD
jgi:hypothetical protein